MAAVWCAGAPLFFSLWIVAGMVIAWPESRALGRVVGPYCNCGDVEGLDEAITGHGGSDILVHPDLSCCFQPSCFIVDCIIVFPCFFINI